MMNAEREMMNEKSNEAVGCLYSSFIVQHSALLWNFPPFANRHHMDRVETAAGRRNDPVQLSRRFINRLVRQPKRAPVTRQHPVGAQIKERLIRLSWVHV